MHYLIFDKSPDRPWLVRAFKFQNQINHFVFDAFVVFPNAPIFILFPFGVGSFEKSEAGSPASIQGLVMVSFTH